MRPETLPKSYWKFIVKSGPIETPALEAVRRSIRKLPIDLHSFNAFIKKRGGTAFLTTAFPAQVSTVIIIAQQQLQNITLGLRNITLFLRKHLFLTAL